MDLNLDEQKLLAGFRRLSPEGKKELVDFAAFLVKKYQHTSDDTTSQEANQCKISSGDARPEAAKEPIFTE
ncbi:MAG TPA: DUF2281 domain-containing protein [Geobacteraceae bacterium]